ncbi:CHAT domain-containing protein [Streptomyces niveus]|uniref:CHAT domain-containing protein n=1 Tax=Streptomyces niveus TaxID=193462 RepID=A0ABZ2A411_STRNV|nr:CHAT domain-containing protein [Streptomyces niveus]
MSVTSRERLLAAVADRVTRVNQHGDGTLLFGAGADAELGALLRGCDLRTDMEARYVAGWLFWFRCVSLGEGKGAEEGSSAGMLLYPVWARDRNAVPAELATLWAAQPPESWPDPANADGPEEWSLVCLAATAAGQGRQLPGAPPEMAKAFELAGARSDVTRAQAIGAGRLAVLATDDDDPERAVRVGWLSEAVAAAAGAWGDDELREESSRLADEALRLQRRALRRTPAGHPERMPRLSDHGLSLVRRYEHTSDPQNSEDLEEGIGIARDVVAQTAGDHPDLPRYRSILARALSLRLDRSGGAVAEFDEVVELYRQAAPGDPNGTGAGLANLGGALLKRYEVTGGLPDLEEAITVLSRSRRETWADPGERSRADQQLGLALRTRHGRVGDVRDLEEARRLLGGDPPGDTGETPGRALQRLVNSALELRGRYERSLGDPGDLRTATAKLREALAMVPAGHASRPGVLNNLGAALVSSYQQSSELGELTEAVDVLRESVRETPDGHNQLDGRLINLSGALMLRFDRLQDSADLAESLDCRRRAAALPGTSPVKRAAILSATGGALMRTADRTDDPVTADQAVEHIRASLELTGATDPLLPQRQLALAITLLRRFGIRPRRHDLREARTLADAVLAALPAGSPRRGNALMVAAATRGASSNTRDQMVQLLREAVDVTPPDHPNLTMRLSSLGAALAERYARTGAEDDLKQSAGVFREAALEPQCPPSERLEAAWKWARAGMDLGRPDLALKAYVVAVDLMPALSPRHLLREDQELRLAETTGLGAEAAACAVRCGEPGLAVRLLDQARGVLLAQAFDANSDLTELARKAPELAARLVRLRDGLDESTSALEPGEAEEPEEPAESGDPASDRRQRLTAQWDELTARIRAQYPELRLFRSVRDWDETELYATAAHGPVVLVHVPRADSGGGTGAPAGGALVVTGRSVEAVPLPRLTAPEVTARTERFHAALARLNAPGTGHEEALRAQGEVRSTLDWLWSAVTGPVLDRLGLGVPQEGQPLPRVWWSPGGLLGTLPLHAAAPDGTEPGALDRVVSSYAPTLRTLHHARTRAPARIPSRAYARPAAGGAGARRDDSVLIVAVPEAAGHPALHGAREEAEWLAERLPYATVLADDAATRTTVEARLRDHAHAHFACHAVSDPLRPSAGRLVLHGPPDASPTIRDLARLRLPGARLAYLSACDTMRISAELADESVHIASAFQMAGFPHVVGSLWQVDDTVGTRIARRVYEQLDTGAALSTEATARALHRAVIEVRADYPRTPSLWACQIHAGP